MHKHPQLKMKVVDGSSLAVAVVINSIPKGTTQVVLRGALTKVAYAIAFALCQKGIQVVTLREDEHEKLRKSFGAKSECNNLLLSRSYSQKVNLFFAHLKRKTKQIYIIYPDQYFCRYGWWEKG